MVTLPTPESSPDSTLATPRPWTSTEAEGTSLNPQQLLSPLATLFSNLAGSTTSPEQEPEEASEPRSSEQDSNDSPAMSSTPIPTTMHHGTATPSGICWTRGGSQINAPANCFASPYAWRPTGEKELFTVYGKATTGLAESKIYNRFGAGANGPRMLNAISSSLEWTEFSTSEMAPMQSC